VKDRSFSREEDNQPERTVSRASKQSWAALPGVEDRRICSCSLIFGVHASGIENALGAVKVTLGGLHMCAARTPLLAIVNVAAGCDVMWAVGWWAEI
jgi:hypothetical protein